MGLKLARNMTDSGDAGLENWGGFDLVVHGALGCVSFDGG